MKIFICAILCCLSLDAMANVIPFALNSPILYSAGFGPGITIDNSHSIVNYGSSFPVATHQLYSSPLIVPVSLNAEGTYIAKTLGSEHIASLPGHLNSASSINLELAPGTNKGYYTKDSSSILPSVAVHGSAIPAATLPLGFSPLIVPTLHLTPSEGTYVAKNLGVEHIAPLPGHTISSISLNLQPAPGSK